MTFNLVPSNREHSDQIAQICHDAYKNLTDKHNFPPMFTSVNEAREIYRKFFDIDFHYAVIAMLDGVPVGSASIWFMDQVATVGPVSVKPSVQGQNVARPMIEHLLEYAARNGYNMVRLSQRAYNPVSLSLYAKAGFNIVDSFMEMRPYPIHDPTGSVREYVESDLPSIEKLSRRVYGMSRAPDLKAFWALGGSGILVHDNGNGITAYLAVGEDFSHGIAEKDEDMLALIGEAGVQFPKIAKFNCPLSSGGLFRELLNRGCRAIEVHTLMAYGPYEIPNGVWLPSGEY